MLGSDKTVKQQQQQYAPQGVQTVVHKKLKIFRKGITGYVTQPGYFISKLLSYKLLIIVYEKPFLENVTRNTYKKTTQILVD